MRVVALLLLLLSILSAPLWAQRQNPPRCLHTEIHGYISAGRQKAQGVLVRLDEAGGGSAGDVMTDSSGSYRFVGIVPAVYTVTAKGAGFKDASQEADIRVSCSAFVSFTLQPLTDPSVERDQANSTTSQQLDASAALVPHDDLNKGIDLLMKKKDASASIPYFQKVVNKAPKFAPGYVLLGTAYMGMARLPEAQNAFQTAANLNPKMPEAQHSLGLCLRQEGKPQDAEKPLLQAAALNPTDPSTHFDLATNYVLMNRPQDAETQARTVLQLQPQLTAVHYLLGNIMLLKKDARSALTEFDTYLKAEPQGEFAPQARDITSKIRAAFAAASAPQKSK
jgi:Flp pilus assembly protein TadD